VRTSQKLIEFLQTELGRKDRGDPSRMLEALKDKIEGMLGVEAPPLQVESSQPFVILVVGVNGTGKTTTIAKLAHAMKQDGQRVLLAAGDTFRAAAVEQLTMWAGRIGIPIIKQGTGADPAAVAFDAVAAAEARGVDAVILDTAGRLHTKANLMEELRKIHRVVARKLPGAPHEVLLCLDATTGQNGIVQAREFHAAMGVTGLVLTKLDGTARGGVVVAIAADLGLPVAYVGVGEGIDDLIPFDPQAFVEALFTSEPGESAVPSS
jgi:fused signal recognition particle receptor